MTILTYIGLAGAVAAGLTVVAVPLALRQAAIGYHAFMTRLSRDGLAEMFVFVEPARLLRMTAMAVVVLPTVVWVLTGAAATAGLVALSLVVLPRVVVHQLRRRRARLLSRQLPDALTALAGALRAGLSLTQAIDQIPRHQPRPIAQEFALMARKQRLGLPFESTILELTQRVPTAEFRMLAAILRVARELGGGLAESLERVAQTLRRKLVAEDKIRSLTSQGRMQGVIVGLLPIALIMVLERLDPEAMRPLFTSPLGWLTLAAIATLEAAGFLLIRKIVRIEV